MPAWPSQVRDDEVWAMVSFLNILPGLDREGYLRLALGEMSEEPAGPTGGRRLSALGGTPAAGIEDCARCHGIDGLGRPSGAFPKLAGQSEEYLYRSLESFAAGRRPSGIMGPIADGLAEAQRRQLAAYYAALPPGKPATSDPDQALFDLGRRLAAEGLPSENIPSCSSCHEAPQANPLYPRIAGQPQIYLAEQLRLFRDGVRKGTSHAEIMTRAAQELGDQHIAALAAYYSALNPGSRSSP
jgi:cytochrome c553